MATAQAYTAFDITKINFNTILTLFDAKTYDSRDFTVFYPNDYTEEFHGKGMKFDKDSRFIGGTVTSFEAIQGEDIVLKMKFTIDATKLQAVIDTASTKDDMALLATIFKGGDVLYGSNYADRLNGFGGNDKIDGKMGDDILTGGAGKDIFVFTKRSGHDVITDFEARDTHAGHDRIDLSSFSAIDSFSDLKPLMSQHGHDVLIDFGKAELTLEDVKLSQLGKGDFLF